MKKIVIFMLSVAVLLGLSLSVHAVEAPNLNQNGSLTLVMEWDGTPLNSGSLTLYRVGDIGYSGGEYSFVLIPELQDADISLDNLNDVELAHKLAELAAQRDLESLQAQIANGEAVFSQLKVGLYAVTQTQADACDGFEPIRSFLISLPHWDGEVYIYNWKAQPKVELEKAPTEPTTPPPTEPEDPELPQTGQLNWPVPVMAVGGLMLLLAGGLLCTGKKISHEE